MEKSYKPYLLLFGMGLVHFAVMYFFMYAMVDTWDHVLPNLNQLYMAALMTSPMIIIELILMGSMYHRKRLNLLVLAGSALVLVASFAAIRQQTAVGDRQFLQSMIPHHSGAILMCEKAQLSDPETRELCTGIIAGQQAEIDQMKAKLEEL